MIAIVVGLLATWILIILLLYLLRPRGVPARELIKVIPDVLRLLRDLIGDKTTPSSVKLVIGSLIVWIVSPIDIIPEFLPVIGPLDDVVVAVLALKFIRRRVGLEEMRRRWRGSPEGFDLLQRLL